MKEARQYDRVRTIFGAQVIFNNKNSTLDCRIGNISPAGAKLIVSRSAALPDEFDVHIPQRGRTFRARMRWRTADAVGVEFLHDEASGLSAPADDLTGHHLQQLKSENDFLRGRVLELMVELEKANRRRVSAVA